MQQVGWREASSLKTLVGSIYTIVLAVVPMLGSESSRLLARVAALSTLASIWVIVLTASSRNFEHAAHYSRCAYFVFYVPM